MSKISGTCEEDGPFSSSFDGFIAAESKSLLTVSGIFVHRAAVAFAALSGGLFADGDDTRSFPGTEVEGMARQGVIGMEDFIRNKVNKIRHWKLTSLGKKRPKWGFEFTVMTYNILSQAAVDCHFYLYTKCNPQYLTEEYRISKILPEILKTRSDVVCLQEVEQCLFEQRIRHVFDSNGFGSIFKKRTGNKSDGCAILWRRAKFNLLRHQEVQFKSRGCEYLNRDNVGLIAVLKPRHPEAAQTQVHVATTHLIFNPRRGDIKLCQLRLLLAELEKSAFKGVNEHGRVYHPTVLCGDFNFEPHSPLYKFVESSRLDITGLVSGNMSGQHEGKDKGGKLCGDKLALDRLGIDESGRFAVKSTLQPTSQKMAQPPSTSVGNSSGGHLPENAAAKGVTSSNGARLSSYLILKEMHAANLQTKPTATGSSPITHMFTHPPASSSDSDSNSSSDSSAHIFYHDFNFVPTYKYYQQDKKDFPVSSMTGRDSNTVDHIFYHVKSKRNTSYKEDVLKLLGSFTLMQTEDLKEMGGLPNAHLGSDHLNLMSRFMITFRN